MASQKDLRASQRDRGGDVRTNGRTNERTDGRNFSPFYRTSSPYRGRCPKRENQREFPQYLVVSFDLLLQAGRASEAPGRAWEAGEGGMERERNKKKE